MSDDYTLITTQVTGSDGKKYQGEAALWDRALSAEELKQVMEHLHGRLGPATPSGQ